ncbi:filamentous hemagglutinin [Prevotella nigrescens]|uniref:filamentous hemagglutinin n=1 Tax=Prevotella nigrescens TaxID=28133 RepID=UPI001BAB1F9A|nr:filamentous hemagglutinin [Prevotella nigrescens]QUB48351.1 filamentous hemagglutinin [Prevotella nigrescens]
MVGTYSNRYAGTFDGQGYTLTINWNTGSMSYIAPFESVENATIKNLHVKGEIKSKEYSLAGLIVDVYGTTTNISGCIIEVNLKGKSSLAGIAFSVSADVKLTITDCIVKGDFTATSEKGVISGFVCRQYGNCTLANCLYLGTNSANNNESYTFAGNNTEVKNCYYLNACGNKQGEQVTAEQLRNGEVAYQLQKGRNEQVWGQTIGTNNEPRLIAFDNSAKKVYQVKFTYNNEVKATRYANSGKTVSLPTFTPKDLLGSGYNEHHYYTLAFAEGFNENTTVTGDKQVAINITEKDAYEIASKEDWKAFCDLVKSGQNVVDAKMTADVDLGSEINMVGNVSSKDYGGTFDGQNHTLTLNWDTNTNDIAPFRRVKDATIKNLRTEGTIKSNGYFLGGLIDEATGGSNTVTNCASAVNITSSYTSDRCGAGGLISYIYTNTQVTINDCLVKGAINGTGAGRKGMGGFVCYQYGTCTLTNCLYAGTNNVENNKERTNTFAYNATIDNCYYLNACGTAQGEKITTDQLKNGEVAYKLQARRNNMVWGQDLNKDTEPLLTSDETKHIYKVDFAYNNEVKATRYATRNNAIYGGMPTFTAKDLMGSSYNEHHFYTIAFEGDFNGSTTVNTDRTVAVTFNKKDYYEIASKEDWKTFCDLVDDGQAGLDAKMTADVDLGGDIAMAGTNDHKYAGMFDGGEHTLKINWNSVSSRQLAPFLYVNGATIKNLRVKGDINSNTYGLSGLIYSAYGATTISGCVSDVNLTSSYDNSAGCDASGMIRIVNSGANVTITDCIVKGKFHATTDNGKKGMGGFVYYQGGTCTLTNCLYIGTNNATSNSDTFAKDATVKNCYFLNACGNEQGEKITEEQLKNGYVAYKLQNGRDTQFWGQNLDTDNEPQLTADAAKRVRKVDFTYKNDVKATRYANSGKAIHGGLPTLTAKDLLGTGYNAHHYYTIAFEGGFNGSTTVDADRTVAVTFNKKDYYEIASKEDWKAFRDLVNDGQNAVDAKMTADVDLGTEILMVGYYLPNVYSGTFDGQGHTLSFSWDAGSRNEIAPFKNVKDATIRNLRTQGKITSSGYDSQLSGLIQNAEGTTTISGCVSEVDLKGSSSLAGILQWADGDAHITINDCLVKGTFHATSDLNGGKARYISGFIANKALESTCTLNNCLYLGTNNALSDDKTSFTFCPESELNEGTGFTRINNCHYLNPCGKTQGEPATKAQLESGEVTFKLQGDRKDNSYWAQVLGEWPGFYREVDKAKPNYVYYNKENNEWACDDFRLTDGQPLAIGLDFTAANVTYERDLSIGKATLCLPYDLSAQGFKVYTLSGGNKNEVHFKEVDDKLTAYTPYYITANGMPQLGGRNIEVKAYKADKMTTPAAGYKFTGTVAGVSNATAAAANAYILQDDGKFHKVTTANSTATIPAYRAYIICPPQASGAKQLSVVLDGETTGIGNVTNEATDGKNGPVYDLQGRRVADRLDAAARHQLPAGVYIVGGRKVVVK